MEEFCDSLSKYNFSKVENIFFDEEADLKASAENEEKIIENLIHQLGSSAPGRTNNTVPSPDTEKPQCQEGLKLEDPPNLNEILTCDENLIAVTSHNVSVLNAACQTVLKQMEYQLLALLKKNRKEQDVIQAFLNANCKVSACENSKKSSLKCAGMPYFKDSCGFPPPSNEDILRKKRENKLLPIDFIKSYPIWNSADAKNLTNAIKKYDILKPSTIDWMKISVTDMEGKYSPSECKSKWTMHLNLSINKSKWSSKEMELLKHLSAKYNHQDWDRIAAELGTNRTSLQCCTQYQTHKFPTEGKWTKEEDETLKKLVNQYRIKDYIPWAKVVWYFENRSLKQCQERYAYHLGDIKKGNFTMEEDFVIVYLASKLKNFGEVAKFLPKRVSTQVRSRYEYLVELSMPEFSKEEDELLTKLMAKYPRNWAKISESFKDRSRVQCRKRWAFLQKTIQLEDESYSGNENDESENSTTPADCKVNNEKSEVDAENIKKNIHFISEPVQTVKKHSEAYRKLLDYHKCCHKFLFGPKVRIPSNPEDLKKLTTKLVITMNSLNVRTDLLASFDIAQLSDNCAFDKEDLAVLNGLKTGEQKVAEFELRRRRIIPPNYMTLLALRTFTLGWNKIKHLCNFYKGAPQISSQVSSDDRILCSDAKKLFKSRLKTIFAFPLILSNVAPRNTQKPFYKPKTRRAVKPLSKRKRKEHAKLMSAAYRSKLKTLREQFPGSEDAELVKKEEYLASKSSENKKQKTSKPVQTDLKNSKKCKISEDSSSSNEISKKRTRSLETGKENPSAPLKKRATRNDGSPTEESKPHV